MRANMAADEKEDSVTSTHNQNKKNSSSDTEWLTADIEKRLEIDELMDITVY